MSTSEQVQIDEHSLTSYSRITRKNNENKSYYSKPKKTKVPIPYKFYLFILSVVTSCLSVSVPLFTDLATNVQSQNLYIGLMFTKGHFPFTDIFATGGFLYYALIALAYFLGSTLWLVPIQTILSYASGIYFYKLLYYFTYSKHIAVVFSGIFYLLTIAFGFGGLYPIQFAMPFVMVSLWFLTKYFAGIIKDEAFILYGFSGAISMLLEPQTFWFWVVSFLTIIIYNLKQKHIARGFYQILCLIFGMILVFYTAGYFILNLQMLSPYLSQAVIYQLTYLTTGNGHLFLALLLQVVVVLASGLLFGTLSFGKIIKEANDRVSKWLIFVVFLIFLVLDCLSQSYQFYHLLNALPFGLLLTAMRFGEHSQKSVAKSSHRRKKSNGNHHGVFGLYLSRHFYLPILVFFICVGQPIVSCFLTSSTNHTRSIIASYLKKQTSRNDTIYVWDDSSKIGLESQLPSSSQLTSPAVNTTKKANRKILEDEILQNSATYVVVNPNEKMPNTIKNDLSSNYKKVPATDLSGFTIYRKK